MFVFAQLPKARFAVISESSVPQLCQYSFTGCCVAALGTMAWKVFSISAGGALLPGRQRRDRAGDR